MAHFSVFIQSRRELGTSDCRSRKHTMLTTNKPRRSFLQRLKPKNLLGRFRGKDSDQKRASSPTSITDAWQWQDPQVNPTTDKERSFRTEDGGDVDNDDIILVHHKSVEDDFVSCLDEEKEEERGQLLLDFPPSPPGLIVTQRASPKAQSTHNRSTMSHTSVQGDEIPEDMHSAAAATTTSSLTGPSTIVAEMTFATAEATASSYHTCPSRDLEEETFITAEEENDRPASQSESREKQEGFPVLQDIARENTGNIGHTPTNDSQETAKIIHAPEGKKEETKPLFVEGVTQVNIVGGKYKGSGTGTILEVQKRVKVRIKLDDSTVKETFLARTSLEHMGITPFPPLQEFPASNREASNSENPGKSRSGRFSEANRTSTGTTQEARGPVQTGSQVEIIGGKYKKRDEKKYGIVEKVHDSMITVNIDGIGSKRINQSSVAPLEEGNGGGGIRNLSVELEQTMNSVGKTKKAVTSSRAPVRSKVSRASRRKKIPTYTSDFFQDDNWHLVDSDKHPPMFGIRHLVKQRFQLPAGKESGQHFLSNWLEGRLRLVEVPLNNKEVEEPLCQEYSEDNGSKYELVVSKIQNDGDASSINKFVNPKCIHMFFCKVSGPGLKRISIQDELERIAAFGNLDPNKVVARLELLVSPAFKFTSHPTKKYGIFSLKPSAFREIEEMGNEGCGFICENFLVELLGSNTAAKRACAIQVRIFAPKLGIFKGVLVKKKVASGAPPIELPPSMLKVGPSQVPDNQVKDKAILLITKNGVHPFSTNEMVGRLLNGTGTTPTFRKDLKKKRISNMILRLWKGLDVPESIYQQYERESTDEKCLNHAFVIGLADPTAQLPRGSVFVPGLNHSEQLFVTRSPCLETCDGRMIPVVAAKPNEMSQENWDFLQSFPFGSIIFSNPEPGKVAMPVLIGDGDLDGDLYFICWNRAILDHINADPMDQKQAPAERSILVSYSPEWISAAHQKMLNPKRILSLGQVIGKLYNTMEQLADSSDKFMSDNDSREFAKACKEALKFLKHGGQISLPQRLHHHLPSKLHPFITDSEEKASCS
jgi:hypothetical protein